MICLPLLVTPANTDLVVYDALKLFKKYFRMFFYDYTLVRLSPALHFYGLLNLTHINSIISMPCDVNVHSYTKS